jgi:GNAT superfamily N-acetyltransferase
MSTLRIDRLDPATASDAELAAVHALDVAVEREAVPDEPVPPLAHAVVCYRTASPLVVQRWWVARRGDELVARATCAYEDVPENRTHASVDIAVHPAARRSGIGSALLVRVIDTATEWDCSLLDLEARVGGPGEAFLRALGADRRLIDRHSRCLTRRIDRAVLDGWIRRAGERAAGYSLLSWDGPCPDELIEAFADLQHVMNTAPSGELERDDDRFTPERCREMEAVLVARHHDWWTLCARHDDSGELAGYTQIAFPKLWPEQAYQEDTGVWPKHRNRGLGRWLKAAMAQRLLDERPSVERIDTWNAGSNEAMLNINSGLGFEPVENWGEWQVGTEAARAASVARPGLTSWPGGA